MSELSTLNPNRNVFKGEPSRADTQVTVPPSSPLRSFVLFPPALSARRPPPAKAGSCAQRGWQRSVKLKITAEGREKKFSEREIIRAHAHMRAQLAGWLAGTPAKVLSGKRPGYNGAGDRYL